MNEKEDNSDLVNDTKNDVQSNQPQPESKTDDVLDQYNNYRDIHDNQTEPKVGNIVSHDIYDNSKGKVQYANTQPENTLPASQRCTPIEDNKGSETQINKNKSDENAKNFPSECNPHQKIEEPDIIKTEQTVNDSLSFIQPILLLDESQPLNDVSNIYPSFQGSKFSENIINKKKASSKISKKGKKNKKLEEKNNDKPAIKHSIAKKGRNGQNSSKKNKKAHPKKNQTKRKEENKWNDDTNELECNSNIIEDSKSDSESKYDEVKNENDISEDNTEKEKGITLGEVQEKIRRFIFLTTQKFRVKSKTWYFSAEEAATNISMKKETVIKYMKAIEDYFKYPLLQRKIVIKDFLDKRISEFENEINNIWQLEKALYSLGCASILQNQVDINYIKNFYDFLGFRT